MFEPFEPLVGATQVKRKAECPWNTDGGVHETSSKTGSGKDKHGRDYYVYVCTCGKYWRQVRADRLKPGETPHIFGVDNISAIANGGSKKRGASGTGYLCSRCHQPKKGHVCQAVLGKRPREEAEMSPDEKTILPAWFMDLKPSIFSDMQQYVSLINQ